MQEERRKKEKQNLKRYSKKGICSIININKKKKQHKTQSV